MSADVSNATLRYSDAPGYVEQLTINKSRRQPDDKVYAETIHWIAAGSNLRATAMKPTATVIMRIVLSDSICVVCLFTKLKTDHSWPGWRRSCGREWRQGSKDRRETRL
jgi:hypothetical protein